MSLTETINGFYSLRGGEFTHAGSCASDIKSSLLKHGISMECIRRAAISAFEAEMNVIIHAVAGTLHFQVQGEELKITVTDMGPGIPDIEQAMQEGFTTAPDWAREKGWGSGLGLPNIKKNSDRLKIDSVLGQGTTLEIFIKLWKDPGGEGGAE